MGQNGPWLKKVGHPCFIQKALINSLHSGSRNSNIAIDISLKLFV